MRRCRPWASRASLCFYSREWRVFSSTGSNNRSRHIPQPEEGGGWENIIIGFPLIQFIGVSKSFEKIPIFDFPTLRLLIIHLLASKVLLDYLRPMITIQPIPSVHPQSLFNLLNRPWTDLSRPPMTSNDPFLNISGYFWLFPAIFDCFSLSLT